MSKVIRGEPGLKGKVPVPEGATSPFGNLAFHAMYAAYDPATGTDRFYGGGSGGCHICEQQVGLRVVRQLAEPLARPRGPVTVRFRVRLENGTQVFNMLDPANPYTSGYRDAYSGPPAVGMCGDEMCNRVRRVCA